MKEGWEYKKLGEVATYLNGYAFKPSEWVESGMPIIRIQNLNNPSAVYNYFDGDIADKYIVRKGDILISWSASLGAYEWKGPDALLNQHIFKVVFDKTDIDKYYLKYAVESKIEDMLMDVHGATMKHIIKKDFDNTKIPYPILSEQQQIVAELDLLSGVIEKHKAQLEELDKLAQSIFYDMFGDPVTNEKNWEIEKFEKVYKLKSGEGLSAKQFVEGPYPVYGGNGISGYHNSFNLDGNYVIIGRVGVYCGNVRNVKGKFWLTDNAFQLFYDKERQIPVFVTHLLSILDLHQYANHAAQPVISNITLKDVDISFPPLSLQQEFAAKVEAIEAMKAKVRQSLKEAETLFNERMNYYFN